MPEILSSEWFKYFYNVLNTEKDNGEIAIDMDEIENVLFNCEMTDDELLTAVKDINLKIFLLGN